MAGSSRNTSNNRGYVWTSDDDDDLLDMGALVLLHPDAELYGGPIARVPCRTLALSGRAWVNELIHGHTSRMFQNCRITVDSFLRLCEILLHYGFVEEHHQQRVHIEEAVAMTLFMLGHDNRHAVLAERFQHSTETINRNIHKIIAALCEFGRRIIRPRDQDEVHPYIRHDPRFFPWFQNAVGALDGTHISAHAPCGEQVAYTNRHGEQTQNVLGICDFNMRFVYVYAGWEGSAHDARVLDSALTGPTHFPMPPPDKYYLVDSAYKNVPGFLAPYRGGERSETGRQGIQSAKQLFNTRHSSLRNIIERCFGVLKKRFTILKGPMPNFLIQNQIQIVKACCTLHNFIRDEQPDDELFMRYDEEIYVDDVDDIPPIPEIQPLNVSQAVRQQWNTMRDTVRDQMWGSYRSQRH